MALFRILQVFEYVRDRGHFATDAVHRYTDPIVDFYLRFRHHTIKFTFYVPRGCVYCRQTVLRVAQNRPSLYYTRILENGKVCA